MPSTAQDRSHRGPLAALLILLSLFLTSGTAAAGNDPRPSARPGSSRNGAATALLPASVRTSPDDEAPGAGPSVLPAAPAIATERLQPRRSAGFGSISRTAIPRGAGASYRARAPPAS